MILDAIAAQRQEWLYDALERAHAVFNEYLEAPTIYQQGNALVELCNAMSDLATYHPRFNNRTGEIDSIEDDE